LSKAVFEHLENIHITADIFGKDSGSIYEKGLIDSITEQEFDIKVMNLKATWDCLQPGFHSWFVKIEAELFKRQMASSNSCCCALTYSSIF
jgi:hypothetical protein